MINGLLWKQFVMSRGKMFDISVRMSSTSDAVTSALNWRASRTASLYNEDNVLYKVTNIKVGDYNWHTEMCASIEKNIIIIIIIIIINNHFVAPPVKNWRIFLEQSFTACMPMLIMNTFQIPIKEKKLQFSSVVFPT